MEIENDDSDFCQRGDNIIIVGTDGAAFKLAALPRVPKPMLGSAKGLVHLGPDFDDPIEGFEDCMP